MEIVYRELLGRELLRLSTEDCFFPLGAAANHGLLYLVLPLTRILDVGAGQTSLLLDALNRRLGKSEIVTLEHDAAWAERIGAQITHAVLRRDLVDMRPGGRLTRMHDTSGIEGPFQLIIMDAPPGSDRYSRLGLLHLMQTVMDAVTSSQSSTTSTAARNGRPCGSVASGSARKISASGRRRFAPPSASGCARAER